MKIKKNTIKNVPTITAATAALCITLALSPSLLLAQGKPPLYPAKPVRFIIAQSAGGNADFIGRLVASRLSESLKQSFVVENRPGGSGIQATETTVRATPDGYTVLLTGSSFGTNPGLYPNLPYDPLKDLAPITMSSNAPNILVVGTSVPARSVKELVALARARPGELNFGSSGNGGSTHLAGELLNKMAGIEMTHVPYKAAASVLLDVMAGRLHLSFATLPSVIGQIRAGKLHPLAVTSIRRTALVADVPTMIEAGYPGYEMGSWQGIFTTAGSPKPVIDKLNAEVVKAMRSAEVIKRLADEGAEPVANSPEEFAQWLKVEIPRWTKFIKDVGIKVD